MRKTITYGIPCYNSAAYMDVCIESLLKTGDDIEILIVDDGSTDDGATLAKARAWEERHPDLIRAIHKENGGHGSAVNTALSHATSTYFKVVDSDDWLDASAMDEVMAYLRSQTPESATDMVIANYVYEKVHEGKQVVMDYRGIFPEDRTFGWDEVGSFGPSHYLLMHSVIYRTDLLKQIGLTLPEHCFYVDNIFVYVPLPHVETMHYLDVDMYRYFIGREDQSVNEATMMRRIDQQLRVTKTMIDAVDVMEVTPRRLRKYMESYLSMMMCICSVFLRMGNTDEDNAKLQDVWAYLKDASAPLYRRVRTNVLNVGTNMPTELGRKAGLGGYHIAQKIFKFN